MKLFFKTLCLGMLSRVGDCADCGGELLFNTCVAVVAITGESLQFNWNECRIESSAETFCSEVET